MTSRLFLRLLLVALLPLVCAGCVYAAWPPLPATTYRGRTVDETNRPVAGAEVYFSRPGLWYASFGMDDTEQVIARTRTARDGTFVATTSGGYATRVHADAPHRSGASGDVTYEPRSHALPGTLEIKMERY